MKKKFYSPDSNDKRILYAAEYLDSLNYIQTNNVDNANFVLLGVNPESEYLDYNIPVFAGNVKADNVFDYTESKLFALENAYLTAEGALSLCISMSDISLINSSVLITGYGRIAKALQKYLSVFTSDITVCVRSDVQKANAICNNCKTISFDELKKENDYDFVFNTVPHPVFNDEELFALKNNALIIDLASFPGGVDRHSAKIRNINLINASQLPSKYSAKTAGIIVAKTVDSMIREGKV